MANPAGADGQIRFALTLLPDHIAHHEFEHICRYLSQQFICSNVLPAIGPVSAGGDQGRDFKTFRTYLREELGPHGAFLEARERFSILQRPSTVMNADLLSYLTQSMTSSDSPRPGQPSRGHQAHNIG